MAKKNIARFSGIVYEVISKEPLAFIMQTKKGIDRFTYPLVVLDEHANPDIKENLIVRGRIVVVNGSIRTEKQEHTYECPECGESVPTTYMNTYISADNIRVFARWKNDQNIYMNNVVLLGALCREISFKYLNGTESPIGNAKFQLAVNRRKPGETDYPWVSSYARQAEEDIKRIDKGSQVLVEGIVVTRNSEKIEECPHCQAELTISEPVAEIVAKTVEYLHNCNFDDVLKEADVVEVEEAKIEEEDEKDDKVPYDEKYKKEE